MGEAAAIPLFRAEVLRARRDKLHGDILIALPTSWQLIGYVLAAALVVACGFLAFASYARVEVVPGSIVIDKGTSPVVPTRPGTISQVFVREGQAVRRGMPLAAIRSEEDSASGVTAPQQALDALSSQEQQLGDQSSLLLAAARADRARLAETIAGLTAEIASLDGQIADQRHLLGLSETEMAQVQQVASSGFLSRRDLEAREATMVGRRQQLAQLEQSRSVKQASIAEARRAVFQSQLSAQAQAMQVQAQRSGLVQQKAQLATAKGYVITAPLDGTVTALTARTGQAATASQSLMTLVPSGGAVRVEMTVPTRAAGFLEKGQAVRLAIDSFPYQQFGTVPARITDVASAAVMASAGAANGAVPVYLVTARLERPWVGAFGRRQALLPGMTLTARIVTRRQSLLEWLFEPLVAVSRR